MADLARVPRLRPPSPAARRVEVGYILLEVALTAALVGLALAMLWAPIPNRALPGPGGRGAPGRVQTL